MYVMIYHKYIRGGLILKLNLTYISSSIYECNMNFLVQV